MLKCKLRDKKYPTLEKENCLMKQTMKRSLALLMALVMCLTFLPVLFLGTSAAEVDYQYSGKYIYNWGTREEVATFLSPNAEKFYANDTYEESSS